MSCLRFIFINCIFWFFFARYPDSADVDDAGGDGVGSRTGSVKETGSDTEIDGERPGDMSGIESATFNCVIRVPCRLTVWELEIIGLQPKISSISLILVYGAMHGAATVRLLFSFAAFHVFFGSLLSLLAEYAKN